MHDLCGGWYMYNQLFRLLLLMQRPNDWTDGIYDYSDDTIYQSPGNRRQVYDRTIVSINPVSQPLIRTSLTSRIHTMHIVSLSTVVAEK